MDASEAWDVAQYERFARERRMPFEDLVALVDPPVGGRAADLGCGTAELSASLVARWRLASLVALDRSPAMLDAARARVRTTTGLTVEAGDLAHLPDTPTFQGLDVIVANASLHWVPDHARVLASWAARLAPGGQLAVQVPANAGHPAHTVADDIAREMLGDASPVDAVATNVLEAEAYATVLHDLGFTEQHVRLQVYGLVFADVDALVEWTMGSTLTRLRACLQAHEFDELVDRYRARLRDALGDPRPYFYPFKRILLWGRLPR